MGIALLVEYYNELPQRNKDDAPAVGVARLRRALDGFKERVQDRYTEGTLQRLLKAPSGRARRAAALALGLIGTMNANKSLALCLRDCDRTVRQFSADALWAIWGRAESQENNRELQRIQRLSNPKKALAGLDALLQKAPNFAEAYNQRAIVYFRTEQYQKSIADCETAIRLNPWHFGAYAGMAQCYMKMRKPRPALKAFRSALRINPGLDGVQDTVRALEEVLGEEGRRDEKK